MNGQIKISITCKNDDQATQNKIQSIKWKHRNVTNAISIIEKCLAWSKHKCFRAQHQTGPQYSLFLKNISTKIKPRSNQFTYASAKLRAHAQKI